MEQNNGISAEQMARDLLERMDIEDAQSFSASDVIELANLFAKVNRLQKIQDGHRVTIRLYNSSDWSALYVDRHKIIEGHTLSGIQILRALQVYFSFDLDTKEVPEDDSSHFPDVLPG